MPKVRPDDEYLLDGLKEGDPVVFRTIYKLYWRRLYNVAYHYVSNKADAEDIVQDVFISLWSRRERLKINVALENYLVRSAKYTTFFYLRLRQKQSKPSVPKAIFSNNTEEQLYYKDLLKQIHAVFENTSNKTREIFYLSRFDGLTYKEIATRLKISVKTVEYHISAALKRLAMEDF